MGHFTQARQKIDECVISGFRLEERENFALLGHYAARSSNSLPTFRENRSVNGPIGRP